MTEVGVQERPGKLERKPQFVGSYRRVVGIPQAAEVHEPGVGAETEVLGNGRVDSVVQLEDLAALFEALVLDGAKEAVERTRSLFDGLLAKERATAAFAADQSFVVEAAHDVAHRVSADVVLVDQDPLRREPTRELPSTQPLAHVVKNLGPQRHRAVTVRFAYNGSCHAANVRTTCPICKQGQPRSVHELTGAIDSEP